MEVPASLVGLQGQTLNGMAFTLYGGRAWWDRAGVKRANWQATKYYYFNGQRVAMRKGGVLTYLHGDHLGSTVLATNEGGSTVGSQGYFAYGRFRVGSGLATDYKFTGQRQDASGLMYFNARYFDPQLGTFISPDTIVPDPGNVFDYNRYAYARNNPLKYNDPSGHCIALSDGSPDMENDAGCWSAAFEYFKTYPDLLKVFGSEAEWNKQFASNSYFTEAWFHQQLYAYWHPFYLQSNIYHLRYNPPPAMNPVPEDANFDVGAPVVAVVKGATSVVENSGNIATVSGIVAAGCTAFAIAPCAIVAGKISAGAATASLVKTGAEVVEGTATEEDLIVNMTGWTMGWDGDAWVGQMGDVYGAWYKSQEAGNKTDACNERRC